MIPIHKVFMQKHDTEEINKLLNSGHLAYGSYTNQFQESIKKYIGNERFLSISCNAVFFALDVLGIQKNDEIISSPMSCLMTNQPVAMKHAKMIWCDIDPKTGTLDPDSLKLKITSKTKAIIHYHWGGNPGYIDEINKIAKNNGIAVIEEASMAFGSEYKGKKIGNTNSDIVCFSFTAVRIPNAVNGYGIAFNNEELFRKAILKRDFGINRTNFRGDDGEINKNCDIKISGLGLVLDNLLSYLGLNQMSHINECLVKQRENAEKWDIVFKKMKDVHRINIREEINPNYWVYSIISDKRDDLYNYFSKKGYQLSKLHLRNDLYSVFGKENNKGLLKGVDEFEKTQINLPSGWWVNTIENEIKV